MHTASPAELAGEDDNPDKQIHQFKSRLTHNYTTAKCACTRWNNLVRFANDTVASTVPVFIHIPKTGGTTIESLLGFTTSCHATANDMQACNSSEYDKAFKFTAIRHPIERAISLYRYAWSGGNGKRGDLEKYSWVKTLNFSAFVDAIPSRPELNFAPQVHYVTDYWNKSKVLVDEFICNENLEVGWERLATLYPDLKSFGKFPSTRLRVTPSNSSNFTADQVDAATVKRLRDYYSHDFQLWETYCSETHEGSL